MSPRTISDDYVEIGEAEVPRDLDRAAERGEQREAISNLKADVASLRAKLEQVSDNVTEIRLMLATNRGGIRMLLAVGSVAASLGAGIAEIIHWWHR